MGRVFFLFHAGSTQNPQKSQKRNAEQVYCPVGFP